MKTWCPIKMQQLTWQRSLKASTTNMYHVSKMHMQVYWHPSLLHWLFWPEPQREYSSTVVICTVANSPLKTVKLQKEIFKLKRFLRLQHVSNLGIDDSLTLTSSYTAYCLMLLRRQLPSEGKLLDSITMRSCEHCITDHTMESYSDAFHIKRHRRHSKIHDGTCGAHQPGPKPRDWLRRLGYYWLR